ncbi:hypothetical protein NE237_024583 [Protea cynaroides]|uniref:Uncharacterized protein n=1 Tax=Protea cynaroides TaxID=273540 RepID=A0A9Q0H0A3_9MAGN|nr:hypothetical protein NE237_024583 [Protea cynaroides]
MTADWGKLKSSTSSRSVEVEHAKDVESGNKADEAKDHDKDNGGSDIQAWGVIHVEPQHVASVPATYESTRLASSTTQPSPPHPSSCCRRTPQRHSTRPA